MKRPKPIAKLPHIAADVDYGRLMFAVRSSQPPLDVICRRHGKKRWLAVPISWNKSNVKPNESPGDCDVSHRCSRSRMITKIKPQKHIRHKKGIVCALCAFCGLNVFRTSLVSQGTHGVHIRGAIRRNAARPDSDDCQQQCGYK